MFFRVHTRLKSIVGLLKNFKKMSESINNRIGIVVLNYNSHDLTVALAKKIANMNVVDKICVVDNCSRDSFDGDFTDAKIHYIKNTRNAGYAAGNNIGLRYLVEKEQCDVVFISNPDVYFEEKVITDIVETLNVNPDIAIVSTKRYGPNNTSMHQYHKFPSFKKSFFNNFFLLSKLNKYESNEEQLRRVEEAKRYLVVDAVPGAFFGMRSSMLKEIGFLYEGTFLYCEEIILARQAKELGYKAVIINSSSHIHDHHIAHFSNKRMYKQDRESLLIYYKKFNLLSPFETFLLKFGNKLGCFEYGIAYNLYNLKKGHK